MKPNLHEDTSYEIQRNKHTAKAEAARIETGSKKSFSVSEQRETFHSDRKIRYFNPHRV